MDALYVNKKKTFILSVVIKLWQRGLVVGVFTCNLEVAGRSPVRAESKHVTAVVRKNYRLHC